jgi:hypothetical protein
VRSGIIVSAFDDRAVMPARAGDVSNRSQCHDAIHNVYRQRRSQYASSRRSIQRRAFLFFGLGGVSAAVQKAVVPRFAAAVA